MNPLFLAAIQAARRAAEARRHQEQVAPPPAVAMRRQNSQQQRVTAQPIWWRRLIHWCLRRLGKPLSLVAALLMIGLQATGVG